MLKILVIDDEEGARKKCAKALEAFNHKVIAVSASEDALDALAKQRFDLIITGVFITDRTQKDVDSKQFVRQLRIAQPKAKIIIFTIHYAWMNCFTSEEICAFVSKKEGEISLLEIIFELFKGGTSHGKNYQSPPGRG
jgi:DNA-binding NtrC family response regulator